MRQYTLAEIETAARQLGIEAGDRLALLAALQQAPGPSQERYNARKPAGPYSDMPAGLRSVYDWLGSWAAVGAEIGLSKSYVWMVAHDRLPPSPQALATWQAYCGDRLE